MPVDLIIHTNRLIISNVDHSIHISVLFFSEEAFLKRLKVELPDSEYEGIGILSNYNAK